jgi:uncharacterized protein YqgC (DUF456 family)
MFFAELDYWFALGTLAVALAAIVASALGKKAGLVVAAVDALSIASYGLAREFASFLLPAAWTLVWTAVMLAVGFGFEPFARRFGISLYRLDRNVMLGAAIGMIVALFATPFAASGLTMMLLGAFVGAMAGGLLTGVYLKRAFFDALGSLLGLFGSDGVRLMATLSLVAMIVSGGSAIR